MRPNNEDLLIVNHVKTILQLLDKLGIHYSVFDIEGHYVVQNESVKRDITQGNMDAVGVNEPAWLHSQLVMDKGETVISEEPFKDKTYLSIKKPVMKKGLCIGIIVLSIDITAQKQLKIDEKKVTKRKPCKQVRELKNCMVCVVT